MKDATYDICIIGAGPAGLASLSAVREPYSLDNLNDDQVNRAIHSLKSHQYLKVCVIDIHDTWLHSWQKNFETLDIDFLRSPALAHPDLFDENALLAYAVANDRTNELLDSGCIDSMKLLAMGRPQTCLWKLPSTRLFVDFCRDLADSLSHDYIQGKVTSITGFTKNSSVSLKSPFRLEIDGGQKCLSAKAIILATGPTGRSIVPPGLRSLTQDSGRLLSWTRIDQVHPKSDRILVVGGGLTAVQVALKLCRLGKTCVLCSRRPLIERHFDIGLEWFELRTATKCMADFYHQDVADRLNSLKHARGGGSVPPYYMREVEKAEEAGSLVRMVGKVRCDKLLEDGHLQVSITKKNGATKHISVDQIVLACGLEPDCRGNPVVKNVLDSWPIPVFGGLPSITEDLRWKKEMPLYVVGGLGGLNTGPDAGNLMGIRRAARLVANGLECRCWLREKVLVNPFEALLLGDSSDDDTSDESDTE
jgi:thioredoxin reductase